MQREMLTHFIILSNGKSTRGDQKGSTSTCTRKVKKYTQNGKEMASIWTLSKLSENCCAVATVGIKWGFRAVPSLENDETLESASTQKTHKSPESFSEIVDPWKSPPWGTTQSLKALCCHWVESSKTQPETLPNSSNMQELIPYSISQLNSSTNH